MRRRMRTDVPKDENLCVAKRQKEEENADRTGRSRKPEETSEGGRAPQEPHERDGHGDGNNEIKVTIGDRR